MFFKTVPSVRNGRGGIAMKISRVDATQGSLVPSIFVYAIPLFLTTLLQSLFTAVDLAVLGNMADISSVASVSATSSITSLLVNTFVGLASGIKVILARQIGARHKEDIEHTVGMSLILPVVIGAFIAIVGSVLAPQFLIWTDCPNDCLEGAILYLRLYIIAAPAVLLYNFGSSVLTASGDTQRPLYYMAASGILNVVLNIILCLILPQKVLAVAVATVASQVLGAFLIIMRLIRMDGYCKVVISKIRWNTHAFVNILRYGVPMMISTVLYPICNLQIQTGVNAIGVNAIAGNTAATTLETFVMGINSSFSATTTAFMGQNLGANKRDRVKKSFFYCVFIGAGIAFVLSMFFYLTGDFWLGFILTDNVDAYSYAYERMKCVLMIYAVATINGCCTHAIQAFGYPFYGSFVSILCVFVFRMIYLNFIYPGIVAKIGPSFFHLMFCYTLSWGLLLLFSVGGFIYFYTRYLKGKYRRNI